MTQAFNLSLFANKLNTSGQTDNTGLQNSSVTVTAGTGMSGGGSVALGSSVTLTNAGVTSVSAGTGISVSAATGGVTISASGGGTVSSVATGNGLSGGTITTTGTLVVACPTFNTVGSYVGCAITKDGFNGTAPTTNTNYAAGSGTNQVCSGTVDINQGLTTKTNNLSGTWKFMSGSGQGAGGDSSAIFGLACRVS